MKLLRFSGPVGLWVYMQTLIVQVNHLPVATAVVVDLPLDPDVMEYFELNLNQITKVGQEIDDLKVIKELKWPTGDPSDPSTSIAIPGGAYPSSLVVQVKYMGLAVNQLDVAMKTMQEKYISDHSEAIKQLSHYKFKDGTSLEHARDQIARYRDDFAKDLPFFASFSKFLDEFPGVSTPLTNDISKNLISLAYRIEGATVDNIVDGERIVVDTDNRSVTIETFQNAAERAAAGKQLALAASVWADEDLQLAKFKKFGGIEYSLTKVFGKAVLWYSSWEEHLSKIVTILTEELGPFPKWERED